MTDYREPDLTQDLKAAMSLKSLIFSVKKQPFKKKNFFQEDYVIAGESGGASK